VEEHQVGGFEATWRYTDAVELGRHRRRQPLERKLGRDVRPHIGQADFARTARDVDDLPLALLEHRMAQHGR
jgi:hypothetical protein